MGTSFSAVFFKDADRNELGFIPRNINSLRWWIALVLFCASIVGLSYLLGTVAQPGAYHDDCTKLLRGTAMPAAKGTAAPALTSGQTPVIKFGRQSGSTSELLYFDNPAKVVPTAVALDDFNRTDGNGRFPNSAIYVAATGVDSATTPSSIQVKVCANRDAARVQPGTYVGTIALNNGQATARVPFTITLSNTETRDLVTFYFSLVLIVGSFYSWALQKSITADQNVLCLTAVERFLRWLPSLAGVIALVAGTAAALAIFNAQYLASDVWGAALKDYWGLLGAMFLAFIGAATVARVPGTRSSSVPNVTAVLPPNGPAGEEVTITGANFAGAIAVSFGDAVQRGLHIESDNIITVAAPEHAAGRVDVTVTSIAGTSATSDSTKFTYNA